jgi:hypothetical protein
MSARTVSPRLLRRPKRRRHADSQYTRVAGFEMVLALREKHRRQLRLRLISLTIVAVAALTWLLW